MPQLECVSWSQFKQIAVTNKDLSLQYTQDSTGYDVYGPDLDGIIWHYRLLNDGGTDVTDFLNNYAPNSNQSIRLASQVVFPSSTYTTTSTLANVSSPYDVRMLSNFSINISNTGTGTAVINILGSVDNQNYDVLLVSGQSLSSGSGFHFQTTTAFQSIVVQAEIASLSTATTLVTAAYGII